MSRIIAGRAGGLPLRSVPGTGTRPTTDRTKEAMFSWLSSRGWLDGTAVADLYAGSGSLGLEAWSRGAGSVLFVEKDRRAASVCSANVRAVAQALRSPVPQVIVRPVDAVLDQLIAAGHPAEAATGPAGPWDLILADPPYPVEGEELHATLERVVRALVTDGLLVLERSARSAEPSWPAGLEPVEQRTYGETSVFYCQRVG
ncbi:RsmD family RNA methyltransferase [Micrococcus terreus]|uniref:RsmD family RNA methyltransferase n=1 Tax=Micrococcus terreus TaxID=574650 RepID=UPI0023F874E8|nr:RsmD family RNA methyltransferase [Micrococcus terreus]